MEATTCSYALGERIGSGTEADIYAVQNSDGTKAVRVAPDNDQAESAGALRLRVVWASLDHPHIARLYEAVWRQGRAYQLCERAQTDLHAHIQARRGLLPDEAFRVFYQIVGALTHMHTRAVCHRDLKLENVLLAADGAVKLCDFGYAALVAPGELLNTRCGSPHYAAPELFAKAPICPYATDMWALGTIAYALAASKLPYSGNVPKRLEQIQAGDCDFEAVPAEGGHRDLIEALLEPDPSRRATLADVYGSDYWRETCHRLGLNPEQPRPPPKNEGDDHARAFAAVREIAPHASPEALTTIAGMWTPQSGQAAGAFWPN